MESDHQHEELCEQCESPIPKNSPFGICPRCCFGAVDRGAAQQNQEDIDGIELGEVIGEGAFGMVYDGVQLDYSLRRVAVKVMRGSGFDAGHRARFLEEMQILALLKHPHIAQLLASGQMKDERPYYAMEFIDGSKLDDFSRDKQPTQERILELMIQLTQAVSHAHQRGIVHRDLKPANVLIESESGEAKVIDFGIARILSGPLLVSHEVTQGHRMGTPRYMSPEQLEGDPQIGTLTDIYSLGLLLYELFLAESVLAPVVTPEQSWSENARKLQSFSFPKLTNHGAPKALDWIAQKACTYDRAERYQTADSLLEDLVALQEGRMVKAGQHDWFYRTGKLAKRYRMGLTIVALLLVLFAAIAGMSFRMSVKERNAKEEITRTMELVQDAEKSARQDASDALLHDATLALQAEDPARALSLITKALELWPENSDASYARDFLTTTRAFPIKKETIPIDFQIAEIKTTPDGFLLTGNKGEEQFIEQAKRKIAHPLDDLRTEDSGDGILHFKSKLTGEPLMSPLVYGTGREQAHFSPQTGSVLSTTVQGEVQLWDVASLRPSAESYQFEREIVLAFFAPDSDTLLVIDSELHYRKWSPGKAPGQRDNLPGKLDQFLKQISKQKQSARESIWLVGHPGDGSKESFFKTVVGMSHLYISGLFYDGFIVHWQLARDHDTRVIANDSGKIFIMNQFGVFRSIPGFTSPLKRLSISADGSLATVLTEQNEIVTFSPRHREIIHRWTPSVSTQRILLLDGGERLIAIGEDGKARVYHPRTGIQFGPVISISGQLAPAEGIEILEIPHRQEFLTRMDGDRQIKRWDAITGNQIGSGLRHQDGVYWFNCSLDGKFLFSIDQADEDPQRSFLRIWSLRTQKEIVPALAHDAPMYWATIIDNGQRIATAIAGGVVRRWTISK